MNGQERGQENLLLSMASNVTLDEIMRGVYYEQNRDPSLTLRMTKGAQNDGRVR